MRISSRTTSQKESCRLPGLLLIKKRKVRLLRRHLRLPPRVSIRVLRMLCHQRYHLNRHHLYPVHPPLESARMVCLHHHRHLQRRQLLDHLSLCSKYHHLMFLHQESFPALLCEAKHRQDRRRRPRLVQLEGLLHINRLTVLHPVFPIEGRLKGINTVYHRRFQVQEHRFNKGHRRRACQIVVHLLFCLQERVQALHYLRLAIWQLDQYQLRPRYLRELLFKTGFSLHLHMQHLVSRLYHHLHLHIDMPTLVLS